MTTRVPLLLLLFTTALVSTASDFRKTTWGMTQAEVIASLRSLRLFGGRWGTWAGLAPDGSPLFVRDISTQELYALDVQWP